MRFRAMTIFLVSVVSHLTLLIVAGAEEVRTDRFLYPMTPARTAVPPAFVLDISDVESDADLVEWAGQSKTLCEEWYPIVCRFLATEEWNAPPQVTLIFKKELKVPAFAGGNQIHVSAKWVKEHPDDFGCVIHELTHIIQAYPHSRDKPGWLVEGIADYIRFWKYEPEVPRPRIDREKASYKDSYRTTAAFLAWISWKYDKRIVPKLDRALRQGKYSDAIFGDVTGRSLDALWEEFVSR